MSQSPTTATLMFVAHRAAETLVQEALHTNGFDDLTSAQMRIAQRLSPVGIRLTELAEQAGVTKQTAGALVEELERNGYVTRTADPSDARARLVVLSAKGLRLCAAAETAVVAVERQWRRHLGANEFRQMRDALEKLREITDPYR